MMYGLVAALALGFVPGPAEGGTDVTQVRVPYRTLIVGTWDRLTEGGYVETVQFHRNGRFTWTIPLTDGTLEDAGSGTYRVDGRRLKLGFDPGGPETVELVQLDGRVVVWKTVPHRHGPNQVVTEDLGPKRFRRR
jgi:hypothetical protein